MRFSIFITIFLIVSCSTENNIKKELILSGRVAEPAEYLILEKDTIHINQGVFLDTISQEKSQYKYIKLSSWKWPRIIYLETGENYGLHFDSNYIFSLQDPFNEFLINKDSFLIPYSANWKMEESEFINTWEKEFPFNQVRIDSFFLANNIEPSLAEEVKQMEMMYRAHLTANYISFQEKKGNLIDRSIYDFVEDIDYNNERFAFHLNNKNFQYYYFTDKVDLTIPDSIYPFAVIDTVMEYVRIPAIRDMIIRNVVKNGLYNDQVDKTSLFDRYRETVSSPDNSILDIYSQIQKLKVGNPAPDFGQLMTIEKDSVSLDDLLGKPFLIVVWGTWCPYCKEELPALKTLENKYGESLEIVAISLDREFDKWKNYIDAQHWEATHLIDPDRGSLFKNNYLISGTNRYFLVNEKGIIIENSLKPSNPTLEEVLRTMME